MVGRGKLIQQEILSDPHYPEISSFSLIYDTGYNYKMVIPEQTGASHFFELFSFFMQGNLKSAVSV
jgi:hypothetical protein